MKVNRSEPRKTPTFSSFPLQPNPSNPAPKLQTILAGTKLESCSIFSQHSHHRPTGSQRSSRQSDIDRIRRRRPIGVLADDTNLRSANTAEELLYRSRHSREPRRKRGGGGKALVVSVGIQLDLFLHVGGDGGSGDGNCGGVGSFCG